MMNLRLAKGETEHNQIQNLRLSQNINYLGN